LVIAFASIGACNDVAKEQEAEIQSSLESGAVKATQVISSAWNAGYCANIEMINQGTTVITDWTVSLDMKKSTVSSIWSADYSSNGNTVVIKPLFWNNTIGVGSKVSFGFCANRADSTSQSDIVKLEIIGGGNGNLPGTGGKSSTDGSSSTGGKTSTGGSPATGVSSAVVSCSTTPLSGGTAHCSSNVSGNVNGLSWTIWSSGSGGCLYTYGSGSGGAFKATWNNSGDFLARVGLQWDETKTYDQYGTVSADYSYTKTGTAGGYSFIGVYGWSNNPLVEYYIVEDWFGSGPPTGGGTLKGTFNVDGGMYKVYTHTQTNQPSIHGTATFPQYFSVRQTPRQCGHISISEHFKQWASYGMTLGKMYEAKILVEAGGGTGSVDFTTATVTAK
jgi:hypothetical protein